MKSECEYYSKDGCVAPERVTTDKCHNRKGSII
jgi:hypothetical protein